MFGGGVCLLILLNREHHVALFPDLTLQHLGAVKGFLAFSAQLKFKKKQNKTRSYTRLHDSCACGWSHTQASSAVIPLEVCLHQSGIGALNWVAVSARPPFSCSSFVRAGVTSAGIGFLDIVRTGAMNYPPACSIVSNFFSCVIFYLSILSWGLKAGSYPGGNMSAARRFVSGDLAAQLGSLWHLRLKISQKFLRWIKSEASTAFRRKGKLGFSKITWPPLWFPAQFRVQFNICL